MFLDFLQNPIILRILLAFCIIVLGLAVYSLYNRVLMRRFAKSKSHRKTFQGDHPTLLYFTTADCIPCKTVQRPAIQQLQKMLSGNLNLVEIDAISNSEMAKQWGVLSVPTIFILDTKGKPHHINYGVTSKEKLLLQLNSLSYQ